jgi:hypothetical protein
MNKGVKILIGVIMVMGICSIMVSYHNIVEAKGIKLKDYIDPYNRYSIKYPAKWSIQSEPVHTEGNYFNEVPFTVGNSRGSSISVLENENPTGLSLREYASYLQNKIPVITTRVINPLSCGNESCFYFYATSFGFSEVGQMLMYYSGIGNKVFVVSATFTTDEPIDTQEFSDIEDTFTRLQY